MCLNASQKNRTQILNAQFWLVKTQFAFDFSDLRSTANFMQRGVIRPHLEVVYYMYTCIIRPRLPEVSSLLLGTCKVRVVCSRHWILHPRYCSYKHTLTHSHTDTQTSSIVCPRSKAITHNVCVYVCVCVYCVGVHKFVFNCYHPWYYIMQQKCRHTLYCQCGMVNDFRP